MYSSIGKTALGGHAELYKHLKYFSDSTVAQRCGRLEAERMVNELFLNHHASDKGIIPDNSARSIRSFLNRLLGLELSRQRVLFDWVVEVMKMDSPSLNAAPAVTEPIELKGSDPIHVHGCQGLAVSVYSQRSGGYFVSGPLLSLWHRLCAAVDFGGGTLEVSSQPKTAGQVWLSVFF